MKKAFFALAVIFLASCAREYLLEKPREELKKEKPLWWVLQKKETGATELAYEDKWYSYEAKFEYIKAGREYTKKYHLRPVPHSERRIQSHGQGEP